ncbi:MAG: type 1 glutamine amidotransferase [Paracoccaceae bacterium]|jgi:GMP synthase (glutamine-hydrolysing)|nr:type 1 glutamine amidotransferase [Marinovum sp.]MBT7906999.1 type 1 glutamine amidotransferase [Marinovum sp.]MDG1424731.1 type 1 glutamine amidotransferase [Paracoccaceae bacterium]
MKVGILQAGHAPAEMIAETGNYAQMFTQFLSGRDYSFAAYSVVDMEFPKSAHSADCWVITGSRHGVYENLPFIEPLKALVRDIYNLKIPLVGVCFGHQVIAQALGGQVEKYSGGWSVGATDYDFEGQTVSLNAWHQDQVVALPADARVLGSSPFCKYAFLGYGENVFTVQAHPEFDSRFINGLIDTRGRGLVPDDLLERASSKLELPNSNSALADRIHSALNLAQVTA